jgi:Reverse transcriptase (RNA-dependent DNA polymerase)
MVHETIINKAIDKYTWLGDSGATSHMTHSLEGMFDIKKDTTSVKIGNGKTMESNIIGKKKVYSLQQDGVTREFVLHNVRYVPELWVNLFSLTAAMRQGCTMVGREFNITLTKGDTRLEFDQVIKSTNGHLLGVQLIPRHTGQAAMTSFTEGHKINVNELHNLLGHTSERKTKATAINMKWSLSGTFLKCEDCAVAKARQKNLNKFVLSKTNVSAERLYMDISSIRMKSVGGSKFWVLLVDEATDVKWSFFLTKRSELSEKLIPMLKTISLVSTHRIKYMRCDNSGENVKLSEQCQQQGLGIQFEFSAPGTPQQNGVVERAFATLFGRVRAMMNHARFSAVKRGELWAECAATATKLENIVCDKGDEPSPHCKFYGKHPEYARDLRTFGEIGVVTDHARKLTGGKLADRGRTSMFVGYAENHAGDVYRMLVLKTNRIVMSRDIIWLNLVYGKYKGLEPGTHEVVEETEFKYNPVHTSTVYPEEVIDEPPEEVIDEPPEEMPDLVKSDELVPRDVKKPYNRYDRLQGELKRLNTSYNPLEIVDMAFIGATTSGYTEPQTFRDAWHHDDATEREGWMGAIKKEMQSMLSKQVWTPVLLTDIPSGRKLIGSKWVFKLKKNKVYRARLCALGYNQVPGVDYSDHYAPVINDVSFRTVLMMWLLNDEWVAHLIDVETAFLYGKLDEEIYMRLPAGYIETVSSKHGNMCLRLNHSIYGLVQAARQWWKELIKTLKTLDFTQCKADTCLLRRSNKYGTVIMCVYVDDALCVGDLRAVEQAILDIETKFKITRTGNLTEYVGCTVTRSGRAKSLKMSQFGLITRIQKEFAGELRATRHYATPAAPGDVVLRPQDEAEKICPEEQTKFRSGVGMLLYLVKFSRPDIANSVRELTKVVDGATKAHVQNLHRLLKYVVDTQDRVLQMKIVLPDNDQGWAICAYCDSDYAGDRDQRISVTGFVIYVLGAPVAWKSHAQRNVTLSSTEAEYVAVSEVCAEILFLRQVIEFLGMQVVLPIIVRVDNIGAIYLATNSTTGQRTRHIDVRYHFVREYVEEGTVKIIFVRSAENDADIYTKNTSAGLYDKHTAKYMVDDDDG